MTQRRAGFHYRQSLKKLKDYLKEWALDTEGWELPGSRKKYSLKAMNEDEPGGWIEYITEPLGERRRAEQKLVVSFFAQIQKLLT